MIRYVPHAIEGTSHRDLITCENVSFVCCFYEWNPLNNVRLLWISYTVERHWMTWKKIRLRFQKSPNLHSFVLKSRNRIAYTVYTIRIRSETKDPDQRTGPMQIIKQSKEQLTLYRLRRRTLLAKDHRHQAHRPYRGSRTHRPHTVSVATTQARPSTLESGEVTNQTDDRLFCTRSEITRG